MRPAGRCGVELFESGPDEMPEAFAVEDAEGDFGRKMGEKTDQAVRDARRDGRGGDNGERRCRFGECLGIGPDLQDGLREQGHKAVRAALGCGLEFNDVSVVASGDDEIHFFVGELRLLSYSPAVLAEETGEQIEVVALAARALRVRIGKRGGHGFILATVIIVAVVIIMAALTVEVKASPATFS